MALINCPECGKEISDKAKKCIQCGYEIGTKEKLITCAECGKEIPTGCIECPICGCPVSIDSNPSKKIDMHIKKGKKIYSIVAATLIGVIVFFVVCFYFIQNANPIKKYNNLVGSGKEVEASKLYEEKIADNEDYVNELSDIQNKEMDEIYNNFVADAISYDAAVECIDKYLLYESSKLYASDIKDKIQKLNISRKAYTDAVKAEKEENFELAIKKYKAVISDDSSYIDAQSRISELTNKWKIQLLSEAENYCSNKQYKEAIRCIDNAISAFDSSDELLELKEKYTDLKSEQYAKVIVMDKSVTPKDSSNWIFSNYVNLVFDITNNSDKAIIGIEGTLTVNDLFGKEILCSGCDFTGQTIKPGETYTESDLSYECNEFNDEDMKFFNTNYSDLQFVYDITSIVYEDGTTVKPE